jgi:SHS2 domain-containing protein
MPYEYLDDATTADVAFRVQAATLEQLLIDAAEALTGAMVEDLASVAPLQTRTLEVADQPVDLLLFDLLQELVYLKDAEGLLLRVESVALGGADDAERKGAAAICSVTARVRGEPIDPARHDLHVDVKAITLHGFRVARTDAGWEAFVIVDV